MLIYLVFSLLSCSQIKSGRYVKVLDSKSLEVISKKYGVPVDIILRVNSGKDIYNGDWIFIPLEWGLIGNSTFNAGNSLGQYYLWPVPASKKVSSKFGERWGRQHEGIDIPAPQGTHFLAAEAGRVIFSGNSLKSYGNMIIIAHPGQVYTIYAHAKKLFFKKGDNVQRGQVIGQVGSTGRSTGPHLHFEVRVNDRAINPIEHLVNN